MLVVSPIVEALRQVDGWPCEHVAVCVTGAAEATHGDERPAVRLGVGDQARHRGRDARRRRGGARRPRRARGAARLDLPPPARARFRASVRAGPPISQPGRPARLLELRLRGRGRARRAARRDAVRRRTSRTCGRARRPQLRGSAGLGASRDARRPARARARAADAERGLRPRRSRRRRRCSSRASAASCPASVGRTRTTGGSASSCATRSRHTGRAPPTPRQTFGHFGRSGTFLWVDPVAGIALGALTDLAFGDWAIEAWPRSRDAVLAGVG